MNQVYDGQKPYEPALKKHDIAARKVAKSFLEQHGFIFEVDPLKQKEKYRAYDIEAFNSKGHITYIELEQKYVWKTTGKFPSYWRDGVDWGFRKQESQAHLFLMINKQEDTLLIAKRSVFMGLGREVVKNTRNKSTGTQTKNETFWRVPLEAFSMYVKDEEKWKKVIFNV